MQDILLEPYGGKILHLPVGATTALTAMLAFGGGAGLTFGGALVDARRGRASSRRRSARSLAYVAFAAVIFAAPARFARPFRSRRRPHRRWRRPVRPWHADRLDGICARRRIAALRLAPGAPHRRPRRDWRSPSAVSSTMSARTWPAAACLAKLSPIPATGIRWSMRSRFYCYSRRSSRSARLSDRAPRNSAKKPQALNWPLQLA